MGEITLASLWFRKTLTQKITPICTNSLTNSRYPPNINSWPILQLWYSRVNSLIPYIDLRYLLVQCNHLVYRSNIGGNSAMNTSTRCLCVRPLWGQLIWRSVTWASNMSVGTTRNSQLMPFRKLSQSAKESKERFTLQISNMSQKHKKRGGYQTTNFVKFIGMWHIHNALVVE